MADFLHKLRRAFTLHAPVCVRRVCVCVSVCLCVAVCLSVDTYIAHSPSGLSNSGPRRCMLEGLS